MTMDKHEEIYGEKLTFNFKMKLSIFSLKRPDPGLLLTGRITLKSRHQSLTLLAQVTHLEWDRYLCNEITIVKINYIYVMKSP